MEKFLFDPGPKPDPNRDPLVCVPPPKFGGETYDAKRDGPRLKTQLDHVRHLMSDGGWWTLSRLRTEMYQRFGIKASDAGLSARIRDLKKPQFGGLETEKKRRGESAQWIYRIKK